MVYFCFFIFHSQKGSLEYEQNTPASWQINKRRLQDPPSLFYDDRRYQVNAETSILLYDTAIKHVRI